MTEQTEQNAQTERIDRDAGTARRRRFPDLLTIVVGVLALLAAAYVLTDGQVGLPALDIRGVIAAGTLVAGALLLISSVRGSNRR